MSGIPQNLKQIRVEAGMNQSELAARLGVSASRLSRMESGEIEMGLTDVREFLSIVDTERARDFLEYLDITWEGRTTIPFDHADWRLLHDAATLVHAIGEAKEDPEMKAVFQRRLDLYEEEILALIRYLEDRQHTIAVTGSIGIGKTTAICNITDLVLSDESSPEKKPVLEVGGGATTVCEVVIRASPNYGILIEPLPDDMIRREVQDFSDFLLASAGRCGNDTELVVSEDLSISREIERAIRNMSGLKKKRIKTEDGKRTVEDPAIALANRLADPRELAIEILTMMNLPRRDKRSLWCPDTAVNDPLKWLQANFADINNGRNPEFSLPKRIEIVLPYHMVRNILDLDSGRDSSANLDLCIIDTKGIDQTAERADLERHFYDQRTVTILCSGFNDAPEQSAQTLLKRAIEAKAPDVYRKSMILVLPRANEALAVKDESGTNSETDEDGYELKGEQVELRLNGLGLPGLPCVFYNAHKDSARGVKKAILERIDGLRATHKERLKALLTRVQVLIANKSNAQRAEVMALAARQVQTWIARNRTLREVRSHVEDDLLGAIGKAHASTLRATLRRRGEWHNLDYSHHLSYGSRAVLSKKIDACLNDFNALLTNLKNTDDFALASDFLDQVIGQMDKGVQQMLSEVQVAGPAAFGDHLADAQKELWIPCLQEWGSGRGFRERVKERNIEWFEQMEEIARFLHGFFEEKWHKLLDEIDSLLEESAKEAYSVVNTQPREKQAPTTYQSLDEGEASEADIRIYLEQIGQFATVNEVAFKEFQEKLDDVLATLTELEEKVLRLRFGFGDGYPRHYEEVACAFNLSPNEVNEIESQALRKLRHPTRARELKTFTSWSIGN